MKDKKNPLSLMNPVGWAKRSVPNDIEANSRMLGTRSLSRKAGFCPAYGCETEAMKK
jgi:hypothetical protein